MREWERARPRLGRSGLAIVSAVLAACGGAVHAVSVLSDGEDAGPAPSGDAAPATSAQNPADAEADGADALGPVSCPPPYDPYWDLAFDGGVQPPVCGLITRGDASDSMSVYVTGELYCAFQAHFPRPHIGPCPPICEAIGIMGVYCQANGALDDAGNCLSQPDASYRISCGAGGRRPAGLPDFVSKGATAAGAYLAHQAALEAASVTAFEDLGREPTELGAPAELVARCQRAAREEVTHAELCSRLARQRGGAVVDAPPAARSGPPRSLARLAVDNAVEGLVRETYAAALAVHQAEHAEGEAMRRDFTVIARDELAHAELSRDLHAWVSQLLSPADRAEVRGAMLRTISGLEVETPRHDLRALGLPDASSAAALRAELGRRLWAGEVAALA